VPSNLGLRIILFHRSVNQPVNLLLVVEPEALPCEYLRILKQQTPKVYEASIIAARWIGGVRGPAIQRPIACARALGVDAVPLYLYDAVGAEAGERPAAPRTEVGA
jgi:hypothetical protein